MALHLIFNDAAEELINIGAVYTGAVASGYSDDAIADASRSHRWRSTTVAGGAGTEIAGVGYETTAGSFSYDSYIFLGAHKAIIEGGTYLRLKVKNITDTWGTIANISTDLQRDELVGEHLQDVYYYDPQILKRGAAFDVIKNSTLDRAFECSGVILGRRFNFGYNPIFSSEFTEIPYQARDYQPPDANVPRVRVEKSFSLKWQAVDPSTIAEFKAKAHLRSWPICIYDDTADIIPWKLEHCFIADYKHTIINEDNHNIEIDFLRLEHYESCLI